MHPALTRPNVSRRQCKNAGQFRAVGCLSRRGPTAFQVPARRLFVWHGRGWTTDPERPRCVIALAPASARDLGPTNRPSSSAIGRSFSCELLDSGRPTLLSRMATPVASHLDELALQSTVVDYGDIR